MALWGEALVVFGAGYVLGTRAGRERFESIASAAAALVDRLDAYSQTARDGRDDAAPRTRSTR